MLAMDKLTERPSKRLKTDHSFADDDETASEVESETESETEAPRVASNESTEGRHEPQFTSASERIASHQQYGDEHPIPQHSEHSDDSPIEPRMRLMPSPVQLTRIRDLPTEDNVDSISLHDILGDPLIRTVHNFNYLFSIDWIMYVE